MKFVKYATLAIAALVSNSEAMQLTKHHHHPRSQELVATLPDVRSETPTEADIAAHERARRDAARVRWNRFSWTANEFKQELDEVNKDLSFGVSYSQKARNDDARERLEDLAKGVEWVSEYFQRRANGSPEGGLNEEDAHNIATMIFYDVQVEENMKALGMTEDPKLTLAANRLKALQKLYLFQQKGGENYLGDDVQTK